MDSKSKLKQGLQVALGVFVGWALVVPLIGLCEWRFGLMSGALSSLLIMVAYYFLALRAPDDGHDSKT